MSTNRDTSWQIAESSTSHFILSWHKSGSEDMFAGSKHAICLTMVCSWCLSCIFWTMLAKQSTQSLLNSNTRKKAWIFCTQAIIWSFSTIPLKVLNISGEHLAFTHFCPSAFECKSINIIMVSHVAMFHHILNQLRCDYWTVTLHYRSEKNCSWIFPPKSPWTVIEMEMYVISMVSYSLPSWAETGLYWWISLQAHLSWRRHKEEGHLMQCDVLGFVQHCVKVFSQPSFASKYFCFQGARLSCTFLSCAIVLWAIFSMTMTLSTLPNH